MSGHRHLHLDKSDCGYTLSSPLLFLHPFLYTVGAIGATPFIQNFSALAPAHQQVIRRMASSGGRYFGSATGKAWRKRLMYDFSFRVSFLFIPPPFLRRAYPSMSSIHHPHHATSIFFALSLAPLNLIHNAFCYLKDCSNADYFGIAETFESQELLQRLISHTPEVAEELYDLLSY